MDGHKEKDRNQANSLNAVVSEVRSNAVRRVYSQLTASKGRDFEAANAPPAHKAKTQEIYSRKVYSKAVQQRGKVQY